MEKHSTGVSDRAEALSPLRLAAGVETLSGPDNIPLLYVQARDAYVRLSSSGGAIINMIARQDGVTASSISEVLAKPCPEKHAEISQTVGRFLDQLYQAGVLEPASNSQATARPQSLADPFRGSRRFILRLTLWRPNRLFAGKLVGVVREHAPFTTGILFVIWLALTAAAIYYGARRGMVIPNFKLVAWPVLAGCIVLHTVLHEFCHALVSSYYGVKSREFGLGLLYYFIPVAYTDRTDAYRLRNYKPRAFIALAGPAWDVSAAGLSATVALLTSGWLNSTFHVLALYQLISVISNLNPLLPGDGYHALEAAFKELNFRRRALTFFLRRLTGQEMPPQLDRLAVRQRTFYTLYALIVFAYLAFTLFLTSSAVVNVARAFTNG